MAITRKHGQLKANDDTGFGGNPDNYGGRFVNRDGSFNVKKEGFCYSEKIQHFLIRC